jgi:hypothetical protein
MAQFYTDSHDHAVQMTFTQARRALEKLALPDTLHGEIPVRFLPTIQQKLHILLKANQEHHFHELMTLTRAARETEQPIFWRI